MALYSDEGPAKTVAPRRDAGARRVRAKATVFMVIALGSGLTASWLVTRYVARHATRGEVVPLTHVVVLKADVPLATMLKPDMVRVVDWPESSLPQGGFADPAALDGRVTAAAMVAGEPLVEARLTPKGSGAGMASLIPANSRAMTVHVNDVIGVSGFIHPGDLVDVITTMQTPATKHPGVPQERMQLDEYRSKIVLQNIRVLAVGEQLAAQTEKKPEQVAAVTLLVNPEQSERLALASTQGKLQLTMRSQLDTGEQDTPGVSPPELLATSTAVAEAAPPPPAPDLALRHHRAPPARVAMAEPPAAPPKPGVEVVEVMHGDRVEERKVSAKEGQ